MKAVADAWGGIHLDGASVFFQDPVHGCQAEAVPFEVVALMLLYDFVDERAGLDGLG